ncbi:hypothetical protein ASG52_05445 [Methylobacterium sp. Leaf456]|nr:hypothetical protein ASG52_05445 [Methylobacterium sp. Leaf456]
MGVSAPRSTRRRIRSTLLGAMDVRERRVVSAEIGPAGRVAGICQERAPAGAQSRQRLLRQRLAADLRPVLRVEFGETALRLERAGRAEHVDLVAHSLRRRRALQGRHDRAKVLLLLIPADIHLILERWPRPDRVYAASGFTPSIHRLIACH